MSAEKNIKDNTSNEVLSSKSKTVTGDIYVQDVHKYFGVTRALNGVNFSANFGEIHAIVGGNGCGKSTLAKVMSGVLPIDKGKVSVTCSDIRDIFSQTYENFLDIMRF